MQTPSLHPLNNTLSYFTQMRGERERAVRKTEKVLKRKTSKLERERRVREIESKSKTGVSHEQLGPIRFVLSDC